MSAKRPKLEFVRIVRAKGGGPIRTVIQAVRKIPTGDFPSLKAGIALPWEGISSATTCGSAKPTGTCALT